MNESTTGSSNPDAPSTTETEQAVETAPDDDSEHESSDDTSVMARALKHELEEKGMTVEIEDDGETLNAEKLGQSYRIRPDGSVEGSGVLKDGIEDIVADLDSVEDTEDETPETDTEPATGGDSDGNTPSTDESETNDTEDEEGATPTPSAETESTADAVEDDSATEAGTEGAEEAEEEETEQEESLPTGTVQRFEASIEAGRLQKALDAVNAVVDECRIHLDTDGFVIRAVDPANVVMIDEHVSADAFEAYETSCGVLGVNLERLIEVVEMADNDDDLVQFDNDAATRKLGIQVNAVEYTLALIDPDSIRQEPDIPDLDLPAEFGIEQGEFKRAVRAADMVSDHINLRVDEREECFIAAAEGDTDDVELELPADDLEHATFRDADSLFSLEYMKDLRKPIPKDTVVQVELGEEFPVVLAFEMVEGDVEVEYVLAPRLQNY